MKSIQQIHDLISEYIKIKNLQETFILGLGKDEVVIYERKKDALAKFEKKNLQLKFKKYTKYIRFCYMGKIVIGNG